MDCAVVCTLPWPWRLLVQRSPVKTLPPQCVLPEMPYGEESPLSTHTQKDKHTQIYKYYNNIMTSTEVSWLSKLVLRFQKETHHVGGAWGSSFLQQDLHNIEMTHK